MARILLLIVLIWILYKVFKRFVASTNQQNSTTANTKPDEKFVQCTQCGCHVPISESKIEHEKIVCNNPQCSRSEPT